MRSAIWSDGLHARRADGASHARPPRARTARTAVRAVALLAAAACAACAEPTAPAGPSLVLVTLDTLRVDHVGAYGSPRELTPNLDALARAGLVHENAFTTMPTTGPATASLLTGLHPHEHGVRRNGLPLRAPGGALELAALLKDAGYATAAFVTTSLLAPSVTRFRGFEIYDAPRDPLRPGRDAVGAALRWLSVERRRPVFLWVHLYDPHAPYGDAADKRRGLPLDARRYGFVDRVEMRPPERRADMAARYARGVRAADAALGALVAGVRGALDDPLLVVVADHGEALGEHVDTRGYGYDHGEFLDAAAIRVPLVIAGPGVAAGRSRGVVSIRDVYTTLLEAAGVGDREAAASGRLDLRRPHDAARVARVARRPLAPRERLSLGPIRTGHVAAHRVAASDGQRIAILGEDGALSTPEAEGAAELLAAARRHLEVSERSGEDAAPHELDPETREALRRLGYAN